MTSNSNELEQYVVKGMFQMVVEAKSRTEAKQTAERIMRNDDIKCVAVEADKNEEAEGWRGGKNKQRQKKGGR